MAAMLADPYDQNGVSDIAIEGWLSKASPWLRGVTSNRLFYRLFRDGSLRCYVKQPLYDDNNRGRLPREVQFWGLSPAAQVTRPKNLPYATSFAILMPKGIFVTSGKSLDSTGDLDAGSPEEKERWVSAIYTTIGSLTAAIVDISDACRRARNDLKRAHLGDSAHNMKLIPPPYIITDDTNSFTGGFQASGNLLHWGIVSMSKRDLSHKRSSWSSGTTPWQSRCLELYDNGQLRVHTRSRVNRLSIGEAEEKYELVQLQGFESVHVQCYQFVPHYGFDLKINQGLVMYHIRAGNLRDLKFWLCSLHYVLERLEQKQLSASSNTNGASADSIAAGTTVGNPSETSASTAHVEPLRKVMEEPEANYLSEDLRDIPFDHTALDPSTARVAVLTWNMNERLPPQNDIESVLTKLLYSGREQFATDAHADSNDGIQVNNTLSQSTKGNSREGNDSGPNEIVVIGTQECRPISVTAITFNNQVGEWNQRCAEFLKSHGLFPIAQENMAATTLSVFVHKSIFHKVSCVEVSTVPCGLGGVLLNKGAVGVALHLFKSRMCFVSSHLAAHQHKAVKRHNDFHRITSELFQGGTYDGNGTRPLSVILTSKDGNNHIGEGNHDENEDEDDDDEDDDDDDDDNFVYELPVLTNLVLTSRGRMRASSPSISNKVSQSALKMTPTRSHNQATLKRMDTGMESGEITVEQYSHGAQQLVLDSLTRSHSQATLKRMDTRMESGEITVEQYSHGAQQLVLDSLHSLVEDGLLDLVEYQAILSYSQDLTTENDFEDQDENNEEAHDDLDPGKKKGKGPLTEEEELLPTPYSIPATNQMRLMNLFDYVFFAGDMNYRIDSTKEKVEAKLLSHFGHWSAPQRQSLIIQSEISDFTRPDAEDTDGDDTGLRWMNDRDQLTKSRRAGHIFRGFEEGPVSFKPTFKFDKFSNNYDTSKKQRVPSWCDRVLFKPNQTTLLEYDSVGNAIHSDHRPVFGIYEVQLRN